MSHSARSHYLHPEALLYNLSPGDPFFDISDTLGDIVHDGGCSICPDSFLSPVLLLVMIVVSVAVIVVVVVIVVVMVVVMVIVVGVSLVIFPFPFIAFTNSSSPTLN
ncbi:hypothetical protein Tco_0135604 [Tanacetum coccineum]